MPSIHLHSNSFDYIAAYIMMAGGSYMRLGVPLQELAIVSNVIDTNQAYYTFPYIASYLITFYNKGVFSKFITLPKQINLY